MQPSPIDKINQLRTRILAGEDPSAEEMALVIEQLRSERGAASEKTAARKTPAEPVDIAALFSKPIGGDDEHK